MASGTEFLIEIEQRMKGANPVSELQETEQALKANIATYKQLEAALGKATRALDGASSNVAAIRGKMDAAAKAGNTQAFWKLAAPLEKAIAKEKELADAATKAQKALAAQEGEVSDLANEVTSLRKVGDPVDMAKTADGLAKLKGPLGGVAARVKETTEGWHQLVQQIGKGPAIFAVAGVAAIALIAVLAVGAYKIGAFALASANAARDSHLVTQAFIKQVDATSGLESAMGDVTKATGVAADRQRDIVKSLKDAKVSSSEWPKALKAIAEQEAALGDSSGTQALIDDLKSGKKSVDELAKEMDSKFGGIAKARMLGLDQQSETLQRNIATLFSGLDIEPILKGIAKLVSLFDDSTVSGQALKALVGAVFQPLINSASSIFPKIERFFYGVIIGALKVGTAVKKMAKEFGFDLGSSKNFPDIAEVGKSAAYALAAAVGAVAAAFGLVVFGIVTVKNTLDGMIGAAKAVGNVMGDVASAISEAAGAALDAVGDFADVGAAMIDGLVQGIKDGAGAVIAAITGVANDAVSSAKAVLHIKSPSRVFAEIGGYTAQGFAEGVNDNAHLVDRSIADMLEPPKDAPQVSNSSKVSSPSLTIGSITINASGDAGDIKAQLMDALEEALAQLGGGPAPEAAAA